MMDEKERKLLGAFVRTRRESLASDNPSGRRRTPGLRREELAARAGIGVTWIAWIEQGREVRPSADTLARLSEGLNLTRAERSYLFSLAQRHDPTNPSSVPVGPAPASILALVEAMIWPSYGLDPAWNLACANQAARRLFPGLFEAGDDPNGAANMLRYAFTHPAARALLPDWPQRCARLIAEFRRDYARVIRDPRVQATVDWMLEHSEEFRTGWADHIVLPREGGLRRFHHPQDGELEFMQHTFLDVERSDFRLVFLEPQPSVEYQV